MSTQRSAAIAVFAVVVAGAARADADVPLFFSHQGRLLDPQDAPLSATVDITVRFHKLDVDPQNTDQRVWEKKFEDVQVHGGYYSLFIDLDGGTWIDQAHFDESGDLYLGISVGTDPEMTPRLRVTSVPWALRAGDAELFGGDPPSSFAGAGHTHTAAGVTDFSTAAASAAQASGNFAATAHAHPTADVTGFNAAALAAAEASTKYSLAAHDHFAADVSDFDTAVPAALAGKTVPGDLSVSGKLGVGVASPEQKLDVGGEVRSVTTGIAFSAGPSTSDGRFNVHLVNAGADPSGGTYYDAVLGGANSGAGYDAITIKNANGNVGIGTASPGEKLDVTGNLRVQGDSAALKFNRTSNGRTPSIEVANGFGGLAYKTPLSDAEGSNIAHQFLSGATNPNIVTMLGNGNVGIGTAAPQRSLHLSKGSCCPELGITRSDNAADAKNFQFQLDAGGNLNFMMVNDAWNAVGGQVRMLRSGVLLHAPPAVRVFHSANVAIPNGGGDTILPFDGERWDNDTMHDVSTNNSRLVAKMAGLYLIIANVTWTESPVTGVRHTRILLNGTTPIAHSSWSNTSSSTWHPGQIATTTYRLSANEYVQVGVNQNSGGNLNVLVSSSSYVTDFMMTYIGN